VEFHELTQNPRSGKSISPSMKILVTSSLTYL
jgi:hypothetical protein